MRFERLLAQMHVDAFLGTRSLSEYVPKRMSADLFRSNKALFQKNGTTLSSKLSCSSVPARSR
jgi:hypothetical protein